MNEIIRDKIDYMTKHARRMAKVTFKREYTKQSYIDGMHDTIKIDFAKAEGAITALNLAGIITSAEWVYARRVLKHHYCRLLAVYCDMNYMYKEDMTFYYTYVR